MKSWIVALTIVSVSLWSAGVSGQSSGRTAAEQRNLDRAQEWLLDVFSGMKIDRWKDYVAEDLIEHNPCCTGGLAELLKFFTPPRPPMPRRTPVLSLVDGDLVLIVLPGAIVKDTRIPSGMSQRLQFELIRMRDGKQVEHWDSVRKTPQGAAASAIAQPAIAARNATEQRNLEFVLDVFNDGFGALNIEKLADSHAEDLIDHHVGATNRADMLKNFTAAKQRNPQGRKWTYSHNLVDGDLVSLIFVGPTEPDAKDKTKTNDRLNLEVFRVRNNKIVEHWDNSRPAPPGSTLSQ